MVTMLDGQQKQHTTFRVEIIDHTPGRAENTALTDAPNQPLSAFSDLKSFLTPKMFCDVFPFHVVFDRNLIIQQCGVNIKKFRPTTQVGSKARDVFQLIKPHIPFTFQSIQRFINASFLLKFAICPAVPASDASPRKTDDVTSSSSDGEFVCSTTG